MQQSKNALLVTYYWPPAGGPGVHRWLRFSSFFAENGVKLSVYCPEDAAWPITDTKLNEQVHPSLKIIRRKIFEPHKYLGKKNNPNVGGGLTAGKKESIVQKLIIWIRGNLFIPDARVFWINPSVRFLHDYLKNHPEIDTLITTGPPHSLHVIGRNLKRKNKHLNWVADFRDPMAQPGYPSDPRTRQCYLGIEADAMERASYSVFTTPGAARVYKERYPERASRIRVLENGFDEESFSVAAQMAPHIQRGTAVTGPLLLLHSGVVYPTERDPSHFFEALARLRKNRLLSPADLRIRFRAAVHETLLCQLAADHGGGNCRLHLSHRGRRKAYAGLSAERRDQR